MLGKKTRAAAGRSSVSANQLRMNVLCHAFNRASETRLVEPLDFMLFITVSGPPGRRSRGVELQALLGFHLAPHMRMIARWSQDLHGRF